MNTCRSTDGEAAFVLVSLRIQECNAVRPPSNHLTEKHIDGKQFFQMSCLLSGLNVGRSKLYTLKGVGGRKENKCDCYNFLCFVNSD